jgi:hypothetical protein
MNPATSPEPRPMFEAWCRLWLACLLVAICSSLSCSLPNLEKPQCTEARLAARRFYSFHFGNDMMMTPDNLKAREHYLTPELFRSLSSAGDPQFDYFTATESYPKAFRIGTCTSDSPDRADMQVVLLWRDENGSEQKEVHAQLVKSANDWLIEKVSK